MCKLIFNIILAPLHIVHDVGLDGSSSRLVVDIFLRTSRLYLPCISVWFVCDMNMMWKVSPLPPPAEDIQFNTDVDILEVAENFGGA